MFNTISNPQDLSLLIASLRIRNVDAIASIALQTGLPRRDDDGNLTGGNWTFLSVESSLTADELDALLSTAASQAENDIQASYVSADADFGALPNWSTWTSAQASTYVTNNILNGWTQAQADSWTDSTVTTLAGARTAFKQVTAAIISIRSILATVAQAIIFIRDYTIRVRR